MRLHRMLRVLGLCLLAPPLFAGSISAAYYSELDGSFNPGLPGRVPLLFDQAGTQLTDLGIHAFSDPITGSITSVAWSTSTMPMPTWSASAWRGISTPARSTPASRAPASA